MEPLYEAENWGGGGAVLGSESAISVHLGVLLWAPFLGSDWGIWGPFFGSFRVISGPFWVHFLSF